MIRRVLLLIGIVAPIIYILVYGLGRNPYQLPSALEGKKAPAFSLESLQGEAVRWEELQGKPIVINFWATWCGPCYLEHPVFMTAKERYGPQVAFLGIVYQDEKLNVEKFVEEFGEPFLILFDPEGKTAIDYGVGGVPETFFIDRDRIVVEKHTGILNEQTLEKHIRELL